MTSAKLANSTVTAPKIGFGQVVKSLNGLTDNVTLAAGSNITITPAGNTLTIASTGGASGSFINNQKTQQATADFNIDGKGTAAALFGNFVAAGDYRTGGGVTSILNSTGGVLRVGDGAGVGASGTANTIVGINAGTNNAGSPENTFVGYLSGKSAHNALGGNSFFGAFTGSGAPNGVTGEFDSFFGAHSGENNQTGSGNSFFGYGTGSANTTGGDNCYFGRNSGNGGNGEQNAFFGSQTGEIDPGSANAFFGWGSGSKNSGGSSNTFVGHSAAFRTSSGNNNVAVGESAGAINETGSFNTIIGSSANVGAKNLTNATAIGANAFVSQSNSLVLGSITGAGSGIADTSVGIGTTAPKAKLDVTGGDIFVGSKGQGIILKSPDGLTCSRLSIDNAGAMVLTPISCP